MFPEQIHAMLDTPRELPDFHQIVAVGVPMELLRRRPDVVEAEYAARKDVVISAEGYNLERCTLLKL